MAQSNALVLGRYVAQAAHAEIPDAVWDAARLCLCDWTAVAIGARDEVAGEIVRSSVAGMGANGKATVLFGQATAPALAALANGTLAHCLDFDDTHIGAITHTSAPVWAATLALGEATGADEEGMLRAFIAGFEVAAQVGGGLGQSVTARGLHATGVFGRIGASAASAVLLGLDEEKAVHALATAATQASGFTASFGTMAKPFHAGKAAMDGVLSAQLAANGFVGAPGLLEPEGGLDSALIQDGSVFMAPADFSRWEILNNSFKPYAACHLTHPAIDAARALNIDPRRIRSARARVCELAKNITGETDGRPNTGLAAKFDLRYCTALALFDRVLGASDFDEPWVREPDVAAAASKIEAISDPSMRYVSARLEVETLDGRTEVVDIDTAKGHPGNPMTWVDMRAKFDGLVVGRIGSRSEPLYERLRAFGQAGLQASDQSSALPPLGNLLAGVA